MKRIFGIFLILCVLFACAVPAFAGNAATVEVIFPEKRVAIDESITMTVKLSNLDDSVDTLSIAAPGFEITDSKGNSARSHLPIALSELSGDTEIFTLKWAATKTEMSSGVIMVSCTGDDVGKIEQTPDGGYVLNEHPQDHVCFAMNEEYVAFGADEEEAEATLNAMPITWIVLPIAIGAVVGAIAVIVVAKSKAKRGKAE